MEIRTNQIFRVLLGGLLGSWEPGARLDKRNRTRPPLTAILSILLALFLTLTAGTAHASSPVTSFTQNPDGVTFTLQTGMMQLNVYNNVVRVRYSVQSPLPSNSSLMVTENFPSQTSFTVTNGSSTVTITTATLIVVVNKSTSAITFENLSGGTILAEDPTANRSMTATTVDGLSTYNMQTVFDSPSSEALYGLGNFQDSVMNYKGKNETLDQQNIGGTGAEIGLPMLLSNQGYGILWDTYAKSWFYGGDGSDTPANEYRFQTEAGNLIDYYFMYGGSFDGTVSAYRAITGQAPMFPKWAYGLFNSYNAYGSQSQILGVASSYRSANIPVDTIVQDWHYWDPNPWGSDIMNSTNYPNPSQMMSQLHGENVHGMISVWGYFASGSANYNQLSGIGALYPSGYYDAYNATARSDYWQDLNANLFSEGWDAWWLDSDEWDTGFPNCCYDRHTVTTALGPGTLYYNSYPLMHTMGVYQGQRSTTNSKRVFILSRSSYPGQQRNAAASWSGDINSDWPTFARQIPAGLNFSVAGIPYWTTDIGGYEGTNWATAANNELFTRWFQYGAFCPVFRIHGQTSRELYLSQWSPSTQANLDTIDNLRYRLMPYIYSMAGMVTQQGYTIMRPLVMDYPTDTNVYGITDQFMFGPAFLVNPVTTPGATTRSAYLPAGTWYDFWTGGSMSGGQSITANAPLYEIPLFIRAGSIVPMGPMIQYAAQSVDPQEVRVYRGANGSFTLYEDENDNYDYEQGTYATIPMTYNDSTGTLTIGARSGSFPGMLTSRTFNVVFVQPGYGGGLPVTSSPQTLTYTGSAVSVSFASKAPTPPSGLTATGTAGQINLSWNLGATSYNIYRGTSAGGESTTPIATGVNGATYADTTVTNGTPYYYKIAAVNANGTSGLSNEASATALVDAPYGGTPAAVPGTVQTENYDTGGQGVAYNVSGVNGTDNGYRSDGVDLEVTSDSTGGVDLGWNNAGQWFNYTVNVQTAGTYTVSFRMASIAAMTGAWHLANASGTNLTGEINVPNTAGFGTWTNVTATLTLPAGRQILTFVDDNGGGNVNIDYMTFTLNSASEGPFGGTPAPIPGTVQAENYDTGGQGLAFNVTSTNGTGNSYRSDGIDLETTSDTGGGYDQGWTSPGQWFKYTVNVSTAGTYTIACRVAAGAGAASFHIQNASGTNLTGAISVPSTGGWQTWTTVNATATLPAGLQTLTVWQDTGGFNVNYFTFSTGSTPPSAPTGLSAVASNSQVTLNWGASSGTSPITYNVYRGTASNGESSTPITTGLTGTSYTNTGLTDGTIYYFKAAAVNSVGTSTLSSEVSATPAAPAEGPYLGTPWPIPGTVQSENYDTGGEGVAYHDADAANQGGQYRTTEGVDVEATTDTGGGYDVGWNAVGEWQKYTVNVASAGTYTVTFRVANGTTANGTFHLQNASGTNLTGAVTVAPTGGWQTWTNVTANVTIPAGQQILTFWDDGSNYNVNYMTFAAQGGGTAPSAPTLSASAGNSQLTLTWTTSTGSPAPTYNLLRSTSSSTETTLATNVTSPYTNTGLTNGSTYYYKVQAVNSVGTATSNEVNATPAGSSAPPVPANVAATSPSTGHISLTWTASSGAASYQVFRGTSSGGEGSSAIGTPATNSYADSGLTDGTKYYYTVKAVNSSGTSAASTEASAISGATVSGIDLIVTSISWTPTTLSSGAHIVFSCVVKNQGQTATPAGTIVGCQFAVDGNESVITWSDTDTTSLGPGQSVTLTANNGTNSVNYWPATSGSHTIQAWVDDVNRIAESNENNNKTTAPITVP